MIVLGLTGSIGMGKTTAADMFREAGVPVHDSDEAVHRLYAAAAAPLVAKRFPGTVEGGAVDRARLASAVLGDPAALRDLEAIVHPLVRADRDIFLKTHRAAGESLVVLDMPLLFETDASDAVDRIAVVSAPAEVQAARVLARPGMTQEKFRAVLKRQMPDERKRALADFVIDSGGGLEEMRAQVNAVVADLAGGKPVATPR